MNNIIYDYINTLFGKVIQTLCMYILHITFFFKIS